MYLPHFYYGRDYPVPVEPYMHPALAAQGEMIHRHGVPPVSPRLLDYYRRGEHGLLDRARTECEQRDLLERLEQREMERRQEIEKKEKEMKEIHRTPSVELLKRKEHNSSGKKDTFGTVTYPK